MALWSHTSTAGELHLIDVDRLDLEYSKLDPETRDPYAPQYTGRWGTRAALQWDISILRYAYWNNWVHTETLGDSGQVKTVGWKWEAGLRVFEYGELFHAHHSRHILDEGPESTGSGNTFPVENAIGFRVHLLQGSK